ncbi:pfh1, partial [Symbiodinium pilosum]
VVDEMRAGELSEETHSYISTADTLKAGKFVNATVVVANKYQINKDWAKACARDAQVCDKEIRRLQYRDMDPEGLCGMVPLAISMPVVPGPLAEVAPDGYVKFEGADWRLDGATESGRRRILPVTRTWKLDRTRKPAVLKVNRKQIPLVPACAITAHARQGKTLLPDRTRAVMLDLNMDSKTHAAYGTVVANR